MKINSIARINAWLVMNGEQEYANTKLVYVFFFQTWNIFACSFIFGIFKGNASTSVGKLFMSLILIWSCFFSVIVSYLFYVYARTKIKTRKSTSSGCFFFQRVSLLLGIQWPKCAKFQPSVKSMPDIYINFK